MRKSKPGEAETNLGMLPQKSPIPEPYELLEEQGYVVVRARAKAAVLGAFVADGACMALHRINREKIDCMLNDAGQQGWPEFMPHTDPTKAQMGELSPMGKELLPLLETVCINGGLSPHAYIEQNFEFFKHLKGKKDTLHMSNLELVHMGMKYPRAGANNPKVHSCIKAPIMVARYGGKPEMVRKSKEAILCIQDNDTARDYGVAFALILEQVVRGRTILEALSWSMSQHSPLKSRPRKAVQDVVNRLSTPSEVAVLKYSPGGHLPGCMQGALHIVATSKDYTSGVRAAIKAGGENCARAQMVGCLLAAQHGLESIPEDWVVLLTLHDDINAAVDKLLTHRTYFEAM